MNPIIELNKLCFAYRRNWVIQEADLQIFPGEWIGIIGPNGGGKTTLLKLIAGLLRPSEGSLKVLGQDPFQHSLSLAYVPQITSFDRQFPMSVLDIVLGGRLREASCFGPFSREDKELALKALEDVQLADHAKSPFASLSGGQAQRALIARAIVSDPQLLLLDEPTASVDPGMRESIYQLIRDLAGQMTVLMVTHDLQSVINEVKRVVCVQRELSVIEARDVCKHFIYGVYHRPLMEAENGKNSCGGE